MLSLPNIAAQLLYLVVGKEIIALVAEHGEENDIDAPVRPLRDEVAGNAGLCPGLAPGHGAFLKLLNDALCDDCISSLRCADDCGSISVYVVL